MKLFSEHFGTRDSLMLSTPANHSVAERSRDCRYTKLALTDIKLLQNCNVQYLARDRIPTRRLVDGVYKTL
jgi:hypothetical protein